jgi:hypothetical protein
MKIAFLFLAGIAAFAARAETVQAYDIGDDMDSEAFWNGDPVLFVSKHAGNGFEFTSDQRDSAASRLDGAVECFGIPVYESRIAFGAGGGVERVELMLFAAAGTEKFTEFTGSDGRKFRKLERVEKTVSRDEYSSILEKVRSRLTRKGAKQPQVKRETAGAARQFFQTWQRYRAASRAVLTWNYEQQGKNRSTFKPGFIRLSVDAPAKAAEKKGRGGSNAERAAAKGSKKITDNIIDESKGRGDVFVDNVPMVDQGQKGYCAVATAERVLRYYGLEFDEHQLADAAKTTVDGGTSTLAMKETVQAVGQRYRLGTVVCYGDFDKGTGGRIDGLVEEVRTYNKAAKKPKRRSVSDDVYITRQDNSVIYNPAAFYEAAEPEVLKEMKVNGSQKSRFTKFKADIQEQIRKGIPLIWGVLLGIYPEPGIPQTAGGHMRLIVGFNEKKNEILYSDSWGAGHELKRMPLDWAWTITRSLMYLKPLTR